MHGVALPVEKHAAVIALAKRGALYREIAAELEMSLNTVRHIISMAIRRGELPRRHRREYPRGNTFHGKHANTQTRVD